MMRVLVSSVPIGDLEVPIPKFLFSRKYRNFRALLKLIRDPLESTCRRTMSLPPYADKDIFLNCANE